MNGINRAVVQAVNFGRSLAPDVRAVYVTDDLDEAEELRRRWEHQIPGVPLVIVESPYRALVGPVVTYLDVLESAALPGAEIPITIVVLPEYVAQALVGPRPLQPDGETPQVGARRPRAHRHRGRAVPQSNTEDPREPVAGNDARPPVRLARRISRGPMAAGGPGSR